jgi:hypothetical protein
VFSLQPEISIKRRKARRKEKRKGVQFGIPELSNEIAVSDNLRLRQMGRLKHD